HQPLRRTQIVGDVLQQKADSEWLGEGAQMFDRGHGGLELALIEIFVGNADVLNQKTKGNLLCDLERALDFVHGLNTLGRIGGRDVHWRTSRAAPLVVGIERRVNRVQRNTARLEPISDLPDVLLAVGVVQMLAGSKDLNRLGSAFYQIIKQTGMQPLFHK